jgi:hypothetical protein
MTGFFVYTAPIFMLESLYWKAAINWCGIRENFFRSIRHVGQAPGSKASGKIRI